MDRKWLLNGNMIFIGHSDPYAALQLDSSASANNEKGMKSQQVSEEFFYNAPPDYHITIVVSSRTFSSIQ